MAEDSARHRARSSREADGRRQRFATLIAAEEPAILASYAKSLEAADSPVATEPRAREQAMANAAKILADVAAMLRGSDNRIDDHHEMLAWMVGQARADGQLSPADLLRAAGAFFDVTVNALARHVEHDPELLACFITGVIALNDSISRLIREATLAYTGYLLERVDQAHVDERRRIARDLHDLLGEGMSVALRQVELHEFATSQDPHANSPSAALAKDALTEAMRRLRVVTSDLRQDSVGNLERALVRYIDSAAADVDIRLRVSGDETWAPPAVIDEAYLVIREAIRNALRHGAPEMVLIGIALAPHELQAWVQDDGCGFVLAGRMDPVLTGTGLTSMRERAAMIGGRLTIASGPGQGTHVDLLVPLPGHHDE